jgi:BirA family biotin operon repressor/biotin-[acetyl-CoA-carboxylase] ligase
MNHIHLETCPSTQDHLLNLNDLSQNILVSSNFQTTGRGRRTNEWHSGHGSLSMSFTLKPNEVLTLTSAEVSILICEYFKSKIKIKWPNDLINLEGQKCGGVILQKVEETLVVGVGLNMTFIPEDKFDYPVGSILNINADFNAQSESKKLYSFILDNRLSATEVKSRWEKICSHLNKEVILTEDSVEFHGKFLGIGDHGQAILESPFEIKELYNGSLRIKN